MHVIRIRFTLHDGSRYSAPSQKCTQSLNGVDAAGVRALPSSPKASQPDGAGRARRDDPPPLDSCPALLLWRGHFGEASFSQQ